MKFSEKLIRLRKIKGMTQDELASAVGVSRQAVYKWESGQSYPEVIKLIELKKLFEISIDDLLDEGYEVALPEKKKRKRIAKQPSEKTLDFEPKTEPIQEEKTLHAPEPVAEIEEKTDAAIEQEVKTEKIVQEPPVPAIPEEEKIIAEPVAEKAEEIKKEKAETEKKVGFFGRIFGRR